MPLSLPPGLAFSRSAGCSRLLPGGCRPVLVWGLALLLVLILTGPETATAQRAALGVRAGTPGIGWDFTVGLNERFHARTGASYFGYGRTEGADADDVDLAIEWDARLFSVSALVDFYPWPRRGIRLSGGLLYNGNLGDVEVEATEPYTVGSRTFTPDELGRLDGELSFSTLAPYLGVGFGNVLSMSRRVGVALDLGMLYHRRPFVDLDGDGMIQPTAEQSPQLEENLESFRFFPVVSLGIAVRLNSD